MNPLVKNFIVMCKLLPIDQQALDFERRVVADWLAGGDPYFSEMIYYCGGREAFAEAKVWVHCVSWLCETDPQYLPLIYPLWDRMAKECPDLRGEWYVYSQSMVEDYLNHPKGG